MILNPTKKRCPEAYQKAWDNRWLVFKCLRDFRGIKYDRDVVFSSGLDALCGCYENYNQSKARGLQFLAYASQSIKLAVRKSIAQDIPIHIPEWTRKLALDCIHGSRRIEDVPERMHESREARACVAAAIAVLTRRRVVEGEDDYTDLILFVDNPGRDAGEPAPEPVPVSLMTRKALDCLPPCERKVIDLRYGFNEDGTAYSAEVVAEEIGYKWPSDVTRIERRAVKRMRDYLDRTYGVAPCPSLN